MRVLIIGAGAAGMMAALSASKNGCEVTLIDHNEKPGKKIYITGKGRCNVTNACTVEELISKVYRGGKFLYSAFYNYNSEHLMRFFEENGCHLKTERGNRVFPVTDHASDITKTLVSVLDKQGVTIKLNTKAVDIVTEDNRVTGVIVKNNNRSNHNETNLLKCDSLVIATGGMSYRATGSDGSGYELARNLGHTITPLSPCLTSLITKGASHDSLEGLTLKNICFSVKKTDCNNKKKGVLFSEMGELLFTSRGISGPLVLKATSHIDPGDYERGITGHIDLKPALSEKELDARLLRDFNESPNKILSNVLNGLYPSRLTRVMIKEAGLDPEIPIHEVTAAMREAIVRVTKNWCFNITGCGDFNEAVITRGGISLKEINPKTMGSKLVEGLYFAGEIMDLDAATGGFNLQIAWSTGYLAGESAATGE